MFSIIFVFAIFIFTVLGLATVSGIFSVRVGILNLAIEGMMVVGAVFYCLFAVIFSENSNNLSTYRETEILKKEFQILLFILAGIFASLFASIHGFISIKLGGDQVISGIALNLFAIGIAWAIIISQPDRRFVGEVFELALEKSSASGRYGNIVSLKMLLLIVIAIGGYLLLNHSKWGLRFQAIGQNPHAAAAAGIKVHKYQWQGIMISGFLAGLAGAINVQNTGINTFQASVGGLGFLALTIMIMGRWKIIFTLMVAFGFSFLYSTGINFGASPDPALSKYSNFLLLLPFAATLIIMSFLANNKSAPASVGKPYQKNLR